MFGLSFGASSSSFNKNYTQNQNQTETPILGPQWSNAFNNASGNAGQNGITSTQQPGIDYYTNLLKNPWMANSIYGGATGTNQYQHAATDSANGDLSGLSNEYAQVNQNGLAPIFNNPAPQAAASESSGTSTVNAGSGASASSPYSQLYGSQVTDPALAAYDYGTDRAFSALDARTAAGGGFANSRSGLAYSDLAQQQNTGRAALSASLNSAGLNSALGYGQQDASRNLNASTTNASNLLNNNQFNANLLTNNSQFNANAALQTNAQRLQAANQWSNNVGARAGIATQQLANNMGMSQQALGNMVNSITTVNGIDSDAAQKLVSSGQITQDQLAQIVQLAQAANGQQGNSTTTGSESGSGSGMSFGASLGGK